VGLEAGLLASGHLECGATVQDQPPRCDQTESHNKNTKRFSYPANFSCATFIEPPSTQLLRLPSLSFALRDKLTSKMGFTDLTTDAGLAGKFSFP